MKQVYHVLVVFLLIVAISSGVANGQKDTSKLNQSVEVMKAYHPSIANANKVNLMPVVEDTTRFSPEFDYSIDSHPINSGFSASPIKPADVNKRYYQELGIGYLKLGAGTSNSVFGEFFLNMPESKTSTFGLHLRHLSSDGQIKLKQGDKVDAPCSQNNAAIFGSVNIGSTILSTDLSYDRDAMRYYGYPALIPAKIDSLSAHQYGIKQAYERGDVRVALRSSEQMQGALTFDSGIRFGFFNSKTGQKETGGVLFGKFDYNFGPVHGILDASYDHYSTDSITLESQSIPGTKNEDWLRIAPSVRLDGENWSLRGGVNFVSVSDKSGQNSTKLYPDFEVNFKPVVGILTLYAGYKGDLKNNRYGDIALENYWADPRHNIRNTDYSYIVSGGLKGKVSREISYNIGLKYSQVKDLYFYYQKGSISPATAGIPIYENQFYVDYDNATVTDFSAEFSYVSGKDLSVIVKGNYYNYKLDALTLASHRPNFDVSATAGLRIIDNLTAYADLGVIGMRKATVKIESSESPIISEEVFQIDPSIQLNLGATYEFVNKFKLFGRVDNLLNRPNEQWLGYASQGLRVILGVTVAF